MSQNNTNQNNGGRGNRIRGPTSALSSFLRERNIRVENRSRRQRREEAEQQPATPTATVNNGRQEGGSEEAMEGVEQTQVAAQSTTTIIYTPRGGLRRRSQSRATTESTPSSSTTKKKDKKRKHESDESDDSDDADFAPSSSSRKVVVGRARIVFCTECKGRFARRLDNEDQTVCNDCINGTTAEIKKKAVTRKKRIIAIKKDPLSKDTLPSLQDICIAYIADYIEDVESLGVISVENSEKLAKIISRNRKLNDATSRLFMEPYKKRIDLYDCTGMTEVSFLNISQFCPRMEHINLIYCGRITDNAIQAYANNLHFLKSLHLSGAFLVSKETWNMFFKKVGLRLEGFGLRYSARLVEENIDCLVQHCPNIKELKFGHLSAMKSDWLAPISTLTKLQSFEFAWPSADNQLKTEDVVNLLSKVGPQLTELSIKGGHELDDKVITEGILKHCFNLKKLSLEQCDKLSAESIVNLFGSWKNKGLTHLDVGRCLLLDDQALKAIIQHSGATIQHLSLHSLDKVTSSGLEALGGNNAAVKSGDEKIEACEVLTHLDCGFVRAMDDFALKKIIDSCPELENIFVWGCHMLTDTIKDTDKLKIVGRESSALRA